MNLVERVQGILLKPKEEWIKIKAEKSSVTQLFMGYAVLLAAIPAIAHFVGDGLIGRRIPLLGWFKLPMGTALLYAILTFVLSLVSVYALGFIVNALAPSFGSKQNLENAMKLAVFSMTPSWVAGIFYILPVLGVIAAIASLYGLYILYLGFAAPLMDTPKDKVMGYMVVSIVVAVVLYFVVGLIVGAIVFGGAYRVM
jgi:hypothetical protein